MIIGNYKQQDILRRIFSDYKRGSFILTGPEGVGKFSSAKEIAKDYLKEKKDLVLIDTDEKIIKVSTAKFMQNLLRISTDFKRIIIVNDAHKLNKEAQNSLLKIIEEIQTEALLFFVTHKPFKIYPTIRSRMQNIKFDFVPNDEIKKFLKEKGLSEKTINLALELFPGQIGKILKILENKDIFNTVSKIYNLKDDFERLLLLSKIEEKIELDEFLSYLIIFERKKMLSGNKESIYKIKILEALYQDSQNFLNKNLQLNNILLNVI
ncbi:MAG: AAA family ATPase [Minisyncoccia bacterium]